MAEPKSYSRAEWGALTMRERIRAMNDTLDNVENSTVIPPLDSDELPNVLTEGSSIRSLSPPLEDTESEAAPVALQQQLSLHPKRSSVVDIWRKRESASPKDQSLPRSVNEKQSTASHDGSSLDKSSIEPKALWSSGKTFVSINEGDANDSQDTSGENRREEEKKDEEPAHVVSPQSSLREMWSKRAADAAPISPARFRQAKSPLPLRAKSPHPLSGKTYLPRSPAPRSQPADLTILPAANCQPQAKVEPKRSRVSDLWAHQQGLQCVRSQSPVLSEVPSEAASSITAPDMPLPKRKSVVDIWKRRASPKKEAEECFMEDPESASATLETTSWQKEEQPQRETTYTQSSPLQRVERRRETTKTQRSSRPMGEKRQRETSLEGEQTLDFAKTEHRSQLDDRWKKENPQSDSGSYLVFEQAEKQSEQGQRDAQRQTGTKSGLVVASQEKGQSKLADRWRKENQLADACSDPVMVQAEKQFENVQRTSSCESKVANRWRQDKHEAALVETKSLVADRWSNNNPEPSDTRSDLLIVQSEPELQASLAPVPTKKPQSEISDVRKLDIQSTDTQPGVTGPSQEGHEEAQQSSVSEARSRLSDREWRRVNHKREAEPEENHQRNFSSQPKSGSKLVTRWQKHDECAHDMTQNSISETLTKDVWRKGNHWLDAEPGERKNFLIEKPTEDDHEGQTKSRSKVVDRWKKLDDRAQAVSQSSISKTPTKELWQIENHGMEAETGLTTASIEQPTDDILQKNPSLQPKSRHKVVDRWRKLDEQAHSVSENSIPESQTKETSEPTPLPIWRRPKSKHEETSDLEIPRSMSTVTVGSESCQTKPRPKVLDRWLKDSPRESRAIESKPPTTKATDHVQRSPPSDSVKNDHHSKLVTGTPESASIPRDSSSRVHCRLPSANRGRQANVDETNSLEKLPEEVGLTPLERNGRNLLDTRPRHPEPCQPEDMQSTHPDDLQLLSKEVKTSEPAVLTLEMQLSREKVVDRWKNRAKEPPGDAASAPIVAETQHIVQQQIDQPTSSVPPSLNVQTKPAPLQRKRGKVLERWAHHLSEPEEEHPEDSEGDQQGQEHEILVRERERVSTDLTPKNPDPKPARRGILSDGWAGRSNPTVARGESSVLKEIDSKREHPSLSAQKLPVGDQKLHSKTKTNAMETIGSVTRTEEQSSTLDIPASGNEQQLHVVHEPLRRSEVSIKWQNRIIEQTSTAESFLKADTAERSSASALIADEPENHSRQPESDEKTKNRGTDRLQRVSSVYEDPLDAGRTVRGESQGTRNMDDSAPNDLHSDEPRKSLGEHLIPSRLLTRRAMPSCEQPVGASVSRGASQGNCEDSASVPEDFPQQQKSKRGEVTWSTHEKKQTTNVDVGASSIEAQSNVLAQDLWQAKPAVFAKSTNQEVPVSDSFPGFSLKPSRGKVADRWAKLMAVHRDCMTSNTNEVGNDREQISDQGDEPNDGAQERKQAGDCVVNRRADKVNPMQERSDDLGEESSAVVPHSVRRSMLTERWGIHINEHSPAISASTVLEDNEEKTVNDVSINDVSMGTATSVQSSSNSKFGWAKAAFPDLSKIALDEPAHGTREQSLNSDNFGSNGCKPQAEQEPSKTVSLSKGMISVQARSQCKLNIVNETSEQPSSSESKFSHEVHSFGPINSSRQTERRNQSEQKPVGQSNETKKGDNKGLWLREKGARHIARLRATRSEQPSPSGTSQFEVASGANDAEKPEAPRPHKNEQTFGSGVLLPEESTVAGRSSTSQKQTKNDQTDSHNDILRIFQAAHPVTDAATRSESNSSGHLGFSSASSNKRASLEKETDEGQGWLFSSNRKISQVSSESKREETKLGGPRHNIAKVHNAETEKDRNAEAAQLPWPTKRIIPTSNASAFEAWIGRRSQADNMKTIDTVKTDDTTKADDGNGEEQPTDSVLKPKKKDLVKLGQRHVAKGIAHRVRTQSNGTKSDDFSSVTDGTASMAENATTGSTKPQPGISCTLGSRNDIKTDEKSELPDNWVEFNERKPQSNLQMTDFLPGNPFTTLKRKPLKDCSSTSSPEPLPRLRASSNSVRQKKSSSKPELDSARTVSSIDESVSSRDWKLSSEKLVAKKKALQAQRRRLKQNRGGENNEEEASLASVPKRPLSATESVVSEETRTPSFAPVPDREAVAPTATDQETVAPTATRQAAHKHPGIDELLPIDENVPASGAVRLAPQENTFPLSEYTPLRVSDSASVWFADSAFSPTGNISSRQSQRTMRSPTSESGNSDSAFSFFSEVFSTHSGMSKDSNLSSPKGSVLASRAEKALQARRQKIRDGQDGPRDEPVPVRQDPLPVRQEPVRGKQDPPVGQDPVPLREEPALVREELVPVRQEPRNEGKRRMQRKQQRLDNPRRSDKHESQLQQKRRTDQPGPSYFRGGRDDKHSHERKRHSRRAAKDGGAGLSTRYNTSSRFMDTDSGPSSVRHASDGTNMQYHSYSTESVESSEFRSLESQTTESDSYLRVDLDTSNSKQARPRQGRQFSSDVVADQFFAESSVNVEAFSSAYGSLSLGQIADDWAGAVTMGTLDISKLATNVNKSLGKLVGGKNKTGDQQLNLAVPNRYPNAPLEEEDVAIEVEFMADEGDDDTMGKERGPLKKQRQIPRRRNRNQNQNGIMSPAGQPSFEQIPAKPTGHGTRTAYV